MANSTSDKTDSPRATHAEDGFHEEFQLGDDLDMDNVKTLIRKIDWRIMPGLGMLYAVSLIDRVNLAAVSLLVHSTGNKKSNIKAWNRLVSLAWTQILTSLSAPGILLLP